MTGSKQPLGRRVSRDMVLYLMIAPAMLYFCIFRVWPILNMRLAFYDYKGKSPWVWAGLKYFKMVFGSSAIWDILKNTLIISTMKYILLFPLFVIFALMLNELHSSGLRKYTQIVSYLPHFFSWVVIAGIWISFLNPSGGGLSVIMNFFGLPAKNLLTDKGSIRWVLFFSEGWRSIGWDSIIFFTAILSIDSALYEAAEIDGAGRMQTIWSIIMPSLVAPMTTVFILNLGFFMSAGFDQVFNFTNIQVNSVVDILDTYIYRLGFEGGQYSLGTAVSLFKGVVGVILVLLTHVVSKKATGKGVW